jgi:hypothetical protein
MHWGLRGQARDIAKAKYQLSGLELELKLCEIDFVYDRNIKKKKSRELSAMFEYGNITEQQYELGLLELENLSPREKKIKNLAILLKHNQITQEQYDLDLLELEELEEKDKIVKKLKLEYRHGKIDEQTYKKAMADIEQQPFVWVNECSFKPHPLTGKPSFYLDIDCNDVFIEDLKKSGYRGDKDQIIDSWLKYTFLSIVDQEMTADEINDLIQNMKSDQ